MSNNRTFSLSGFSEAVFVVSNIEKSKAFYCDVIGWQVICEENLAVNNEQNINEPTSAPLTALHDFWELTPSVKIKSCLIRSPDTENGAIRLVEIQGIEQTHIRANSQVWDVGGIFDVNMRVSSLKELAKKLHSHQWFGVNDPIKMKFGPFTVLEWLAKSHDGITHALIERIDPPLENNQQTSIFSEVINASLVVNDHQAERDFLADILGFETIIHQENSFDEACSNVFGLPFELAKSSPHLLTLLSADGGRNGTVELVSFPELTGNDNSSKVKPYNLGITCLRFPVDGMAAFIDHLKSKNQPYSDGGIFHMAPYGSVKIIAINSPNGNRFEYFEAIDNAACANDKI